MKRIEATGAWPARVAWVALALVGPDALSGALDGRSTAVRAVVAGGLWAGWVGGLVALLVPRSAALTALRVIVPAGLAAMVAAADVDGRPGAAGVAAVALAAVATVAVLVPWVGEAWVDGSSYGPERRLPLRPPAVLSYALVPLTWVLVVGGAVAGPLLLAAGRWVVGGVALVAGWAVAAAGVRSLHQLSRRWIVLVPTGLVVHDTMALPEPHLFPRRSIASLAPATVDDLPGGADGTDVVDLTAGAPGLALRLSFAEPVELLLHNGRSATVTRDAAAVLITPSRAGHLLAAAAEHRIPTA